MEWSEVDEHLLHFPACNMSQAYSFISTTSFKFVSKSKEEISELTRCKPNCVTYHYEAVKVAPMSEPWACKINVLKISCWLYSLQL